MSPNGQGTPEEWERDEREARNLRWTRQDERNKVLAELRAVPVIAAALDLANENANLATKLRELEREVEVLRRINVSFSRP